MSTVIAGGLRERLIADSIHLYLKRALSLLGWFNPDPGRRDVHYMPRPAGDDEPIELNTVGVFSDRVRDTDLELGSLLAESAWQWYADIYGEDEAVGMHLSGDVRDILRGKMPTVGASAPVIPVLDFRLATPVEIFYVEIQDVVRDRPPSYTHPWQQFWMPVPFTVVDSA